MIGFSKKSHQLVDLGLQCANSSAAKPDAITKPALIAGACLVILDKRLVSESLLKPDTIATPTPTSASAKPRLNPRTVKIPIPVLPLEIASNMTVMDAGQGIIPPAAPNAIICRAVGRSPVLT